MWEGLANCGQYYPEQVGIGYVREQSEQATEQASEQCSCMVSALVPLVPTLTSLVIEF